MNNDVTTGNNLNNIDPAENTEDQTVKIHIVSSDNMLECNFWLGLYKKGSLSASELLSGEKYSQILSQAASEGVDANEPVLLTNTENGDPKYIYLVTPPSNDAQSKRAWIQELTSTINNWKKKTLGIYLDESMYEKETLSDILRELSAFIIQNTDVKELYMTPSGEDENTILNTALDVKSGYQFDNSDVHVFH